MSFICGVQASSALSHDSQSGAEPPAPARRASNEKLHAHKTSMGNPARLRAFRDARVARGRGKPRPYEDVARRGAALRLLGGAEEDFADEALGGLGEEHGDGVGYVIGLEHFFCVLCGAMKKIRGDRAWANGCDADAVSAEVFGHAVGEAQQAPFG